jgi:uncharacterized protein (DUF2267 family)
MITTGLDTFDTTVQETNLWLKSLMADLDIPDRALAWDLLSATLHEIRDHLQPQTAAHLGAQLPMLIRGAYYEHWPVDKTPTKDRHKASFLAHISASCPTGAAVKPERVARAVFRLLAKYIDPGQVAKLIKMLPKELRGLLAFE